MRLGLFGGSFDPVHLGHLILADHCWQQAGLDEVWFVPAARPPHKRHRQLADDQCRVEMLELATNGNPAFKVSTIELARGGISYTVDTLRRLDEEHAGWELFFLMGADSLHEFSTWRSPAEICRLATPLVMRRGGEPEPDFTVLEAYVSPARLREIRAAQLEMPAVEISSSSIRADVAAGRSVRYRLPAAVAQYIASHALYAEAATPGPPAADAPPEAE